MDYNSGTLIYANNENEELPIASMNKVMTLLLCFEALDERAFSLDDSITVSAEASGMGGSQVFLEANLSYQIGNLIKSIVVASANDACVRWQSILQGARNSLSSCMNERAKELGMTAYRLYQLYGASRSRAAFHGERRSKDVFRTFDA